MSCFGATPAATPAYYSSSSSSSSGRPWRWWRARCAGIAAAVGSRLRRSLSLRRMGVPGRRRRRRRAPVSSSAVRHVHHRSSFAPVYVDDLYAHQQRRQYPQPAAAKPVTAAAVLQEHQEPSTSGGGGKLIAAAAAAPVHVHAYDASRVVVPGARLGGATAAAAAATGATRPKPNRNVVVRSPGRGGVLRGVVKGMGEVDLRAELFIRKFKEDMRLQSQRSAEEFQAMLARGL